MAHLIPEYENIQAHYDLSNEFFQLFLDPTMTYSCAYFKRPDMTLKEAQLAKIDLTLSKCNLQPGNRLLEIGCGWGSTLQRAVDKFDVTAVGLTLSKAQYELARDKLAYRDDRVDIRLQGWEEFDEPVDRIVTIGALEHFREERYQAFFEKCYRLLPAQAPLLVHCIVYTEEAELASAGITPQYDDVIFLKFLRKHIFPGGQLRPSSVICRYAEMAGFQTARLQSLRSHYATTLHHWSSNLSAKRDAAIRLTSETTYDIYMRYLTGCEQYFRSGHIDLIQHTFYKS